jgi:hypothetical protein
LIQAEMIDKISNQINKDFESLLEYDKSL